MKERECFYSLLFWVLRQDLSKSSSFSTKGSYKDKFYYNMKKSILFHTIPFEYVSKVYGSSLVRKSSDN